MVPERAIRLFQIMTRFHDRRAKAVFTWLCIFANFPIFDSMTSISSFCVSSNQQRKTSKPFIPIRPPAPQSQIRELMRRVADVGAGIIDKNVESAATFERRGEERAD
jgi:hypothetical protein